MIGVTIIRITSTGENLFHQQVTCQLNDITSPIRQEETKFQALIETIIIRSIAQIEVKMILQGRVMGSPSLESGHQEVKIDPKMEATTY